MTTDTSRERIFATWRRRDNGYIPNCRQAQEAKGKLKDLPFSKDKFEYDEDRDCFTCPQGRILTRKGTYNRDGKLQLAYYGSCKGCPHKEECAGKRTRVILSDEFEAERRRMAAKMESEEGREEYRVERIPYQRNKERENGMEVE